MRSTTGAFIALAVLGGYFAWRNRFAIQRQLESWGINTPMMKGSISEALGSAAAKVSGNVSNIAKQAQSAVSGEPTEKAVNY